MLIDEELTGKIINCFFDVYNELGYGFLEKVYENALVLALQEKNINFSRQKNIDVYYHKQLVGEYIADLLIEDKVIVEIKAGKALTSEHEAQLLNYLKATGTKVGFLVNFGPQLKFKRYVK